MKTERIQDALLGIAVSLFGLSFIFLTLVLS